MSIGAWMTLVTVSIVLYGGLFTCINIAIKNSNKN